MALIDDAGTAADLAAANPVVPPNTLMMERDTGKVKRGNGTSRWNALAYWGPAVDTVDLGSAGELSIGSAAYDNISILNADAEVASGQRSSVGVNVIAKGTMTVADRVQGILVQCEDHVGVVNKTVSGAVTNGGLIRITATGHGFATGDHVAVYGVGGTTEANGAWVVTVIDANTFDLQGSTFTNAYTSGGTATNRPMMYGVFSVVKPTVSRVGLTGTAANGDDLNAYSAYNSSTTDAAGTDCYYIGHNSAFGAGQHEFVTGYTCAANLQLGAFYFAGRLTGSAASNCAIFEAGAAVIENDAYAMRVPNNGVFAARNAAGNGNVNMFRLNTSNRFQVDAPTTMVTGASSIAMIIQDVTTDANDKIGRVAVAHYTNSQPPVQAFQITSAVTSSVLNIGGGSGTMNSVSQLNLYTGANSTTVSGTLRVQINTAGLITLQDGVADLAVRNDDRLEDRHRHDAEARVLEQDADRATHDRCHRRGVRSEHGHGSQRRLHVRRLHARQDRRSPHQRRNPRMNEPALLALIGDLYAQLRAQAAELERLRANQPHPSEDN